MIKLLLQNGGLFQHCLHTPPLHSPLTALHFPLSQWQQFSQSFPHSLSEHSLKLISQKTWQQIESHI